MIRYRNTNTSGGAFSQEIKRAVWNKARIVPGYDKDSVRRDICGAVIEWSKYGDTTPNDNGWEIDHIIPVSRGGGDQLSNLQPLQWENNRSKADHYPPGNFCVKRI